MTQDAVAADDYSWEFGTLSCLDSGDIGDGDPTGWVKVESCTYTTELATFIFSTRHLQYGVDPYPLYGVDPADNLDWYLRPAPEDSQAPFGGPNGVPDAVDILAISYWQAALAYSRELGFDVPKHVTVHLDLGDGIPYSWPEGHIHLRPRDGVYMMRHELFHQYQYATTPWIWTAIGLETSLQAATNSSGVRNTVWWAEATANWATQWAGVWAEDQARKTPHPDPADTTAYTRQRLNRPGVSGDLIPWKDDGHGTSLEVPAGAA